MDDNFTFKKDRVMEICDLILQAGLKIKWNTPNGVSIKTLDKELLMAMKASGCKSIGIAIESGDEELRNKVIGKRFSDDNIVRIVKYARELGIFTTAFYIIGMPGETEERFQKTLKQLKELPLNAVSAGFAIPLPGTKLYQDCIDNNWKVLDHDNGKDNVLYKPYIITNDFSEKDLLLREKRFYRTFLRYKFLTIVKDTLSFRNKLLHFPYLMRILSERLGYNTFLNSDHWLRCKNVVKSDSVRSLENSYVIRKTKLIANE
jgi:magnesium-protoporphyrin IX monomethyl ester (oxidative) cyclase